VRWSRRPEPVPLAGGTVWTSYYTPRELAAFFASNFDLLSYRSLCLAAPPPYLTGIWRRFPRLCAAAARADRVIGAWPLLRNAGDHFLIVLRRRTQRPETM
jgi:hypothetical protein